MPQLASVLLVDDDSTTNFINKLLLSTMGIAEQVLVAENGKEALHTVATACGDSEVSCPPLILLDMNMPVMNGLAFLEPTPSCRWPSSAPPLLSSPRRCTSATWPAFGSCPLRAFWTSL